MLKVMVWAALSPQGYARRPCASLQSKPCNFFQNATLQPRQNMPGQWATIRSGRPIPGSSGSVFAMRGSAVGATFAGG